MIDKSNLAYKGMYVKNPKIRTKQNSSHIGRIKKSEVAKIKLTFYVFLVSLTATVLSFYIVNLVKQNELNISVNLTKQQYKIQQSENVRLKALMQTNYLNPSKIEQYAKVKLGMRKNNMLQANYISQSDINSDSNSKNKSKSKSETFKRKTSILDKIKNWIQDIFNI